MTNYNMEGFEAWEHPAIGVLKIKFDVRVNFFSVLHRKRLSGNSKTGSDSTERWSSATLNQMAAQIQPSTREISSTLPQERQKF